MNPIHQYFKRYHPETIFLTEIKGYNSHNNWWMLSWIKLDLYFMIIYLCVKYESNIPLYSKDVALKPFFTEIKNHSIDNNQWILTLIELDLYFVYEIWIQYTNVFIRYHPETIFFTEMKDHNSDNNQWISTWIELDLYFMILYLSPVWIMNPIHQSLTEKMHCRERFSRTASEYSAIVR